MTTASDRINTVFAGKYRIIRTLGHGGMGTVYEAKHLHTDGTVALKVLREDAHDPNAAARMLREARALAKLDHPHIVRLLDADLVDGQLCLVQEFIEGETLRQRLDAQLVCTAQETLEMIFPMVSALQTAHRQGVIHRDIKPENIILSRKNGKLWPKLVDFGIAVSTDEDRHTRQGSVVGTPAYMSPEQAWGKLDIDARTDVWSLGMVAYECLAGCLAYDGPNERAILATIVAEEPTHIAQVAVTIDDALADIVMRCLCKNRDARIASMSELSAHLLALSAFDKKPWFTALTQRFGPEQSTVNEVRDEVPAPKAPSTVPSKDIESAEEPPKTNTTSTRWIGLSIIVLFMATGAIWAAVRSRHARTEHTRPAVSAQTDVATDLQATDSPVQAPLVASHLPAAITDAITPDAITADNVAPTLRPNHVVGRSHGSADAGRTIAVVNAIADSGVRPRVQNPPLTPRGTNGAPIVEDL